MGSAEGRLGVYDQERLKDRAVDEFLGICRGVIYDGRLNDEEIVRLEGWCRFNRAAFGQWPLDVIATRLSRALEDGIVEDGEREELVNLVEAFVGSSQADNLEAPTTLPLTDPPPIITYPGRVFCFTGTFAFGTRKACESAVIERKGRCSSGITGSLGYLVIGSRITPAWIHSNYGRKIEGAIELVRAGSSLTIISEAHWTRSLALVAEYDAALVERLLSEAMAQRKPVRFLYRGSRRTIIPFQFVEWMRQPAIEGEYVEGDSLDPDRKTRQYLLHHIAEVGPYAP